MSEVKEQGASRRVRPSDFMNPGTASPERKSPREDERRRRRKYPGHGPVLPGEGRPPRRSPSRPAISPPKRKTFDRPGHASPLIPKVNPDGGRPLPNARKEFGKMSRRLGRRINPLGRYFDIADMLDDFVRPQLPVPVPNPANGWRLFNGPCFSVRPDTAGPKANGASACIGGQAGGALDPGVFMVPGLTRDGDVAPYYGMWKWNGQTGGSARYQHHVTYSRNQFRPNTHLPLIITHSSIPGVVDVLGAVNPNAMRHMLSLAPPILEPGELTQGASESLTEGLTGTAAASAALVSTINQAAVIPGAVGVPGGQSPGGVAVEIGVGGPRPSRPTDRTPPGRNERQQKRMTRSQKLMIAVFKILDAVSEGAEVVDAAYDALPDDTRRKWKCSGSRGMVDNAGQYGIDGADCKAKALFHNWHKVDFEDFVENLIRNHIQDKIIGGMQRVMPRNLGSAVEQGEIKLNELTEDMLDYLLANM